MGGGEQVGRERLEEREQAGSSGKTAASTMTLH